MKGEQEHDQTERATPFKLEEARKRGQVSKSLDLNSLFAVFALAVALTLWGAAAWIRLGEESANLLRMAGSAGEGGAALLQPVERAASVLVTITLPFAVVGVLFAIIANLIQTGPVFSFFPLKPQFDRINPVAGFKRIFNKRMLFEAIKSLLKLAFFTAVAYFSFATFWADVPALFTPDNAAQTAWLTDNGSALLFRLALALFLVALIDVVWVRWQYARQMRMSRREMREEIKRREGDPLIRAKIRQLQRENLKQGGSMKRIGDADVLITNPDHLAVALVYERDRMTAPYIIAKGRDMWATEMRALARRRGVLIHEQRSLARYLFRYGQVDRPIPAEAFVDVARVYSEVVFPRRAQGRYEVRL